MKYALYRRKYGMDCDGWQRVGSKRNTHAEAMQDYNANLPSFAGKKYVYEVREVYTPSKKEILYQVLLWGFFFICLAATLIYIANIR